MIKSTGRERAQVHVRVESRELVVCVYFSSGTVERIRLAKLRQAILFADEFFNPFKISSLIFFELSFLGLSSVM